MRKQALSRQEFSGQKSSGQEFYAVGSAAAPNNFAKLTLRMAGHQCQFEIVTDIHRIIRHDPGAARRNIQYEAFAPGHPAVDRNPGLMLVQLTPRFAMYLCPRLNNSHDDHPSLDVIAISSAIVKTGRQIEGEFVKFP